MYTTTLKALRDAGACFEGYNRVVRMLQNKTFTEDDAARTSYIRIVYKEPITLESICNNNGLEDALWALRSVPDIERDCRLFAVWCARQVEHLSTDPRVKACNDEAEKFANNLATQAEAGDAGDAARAAARAAAAAAAEAADAAYIAYTACAAEYAAADAAYAAAYAAADAAARAAEDAEAAADAAEAAADAADVAYAAVRRAQSEMFIKMCNGLAPWQEDGEK